ncbi:alkyl sulfatase dimerization domain-containing protein [Arthrobacter sp. OV608]|uniref:alkyl/aryl-sulfatase n=1 Tax=Arthrobacter sp. OV608 TaxID=1882768 RepID=UPI0008D3322F|nr:alkyl sulfatase dimerization domain-containing protein [Arthrobacter sp. OV608]SER28303.1 Alkyl sulfatase BDS1, metallo-beta-lactamase superfamily [Arthrobacter sp. OV608]
MTNRVTSERRNDSAPFLDDGWPTENDATADADRGLIATRDPLIVKADDGRVVWRTDDFAFLEGDAPSTVHSSLWRVSKLNKQHGLYEVTDGVYQVRGFDAANMTVIMGDTGFIIIDPLMSVETAAAALAFAREHLGDLPVTAVIISHSHSDHFGGLRGVVDVDDVESGRVPLVAPAGFWEHSVSESVYAGTAMFRRAEFQAGLSLPRGPLGSVGPGLVAGASTGTISIIKPTILIEEKGVQLTLDGVPFEFDSTPETEAKAEMICYLPRHRALCMAEIVNHAMHNIYTLRGTEIRDALAWSRAIDDSLVNYGDRSDVMFLTHQWPVWGTPKLVRHLEMQRDLYRFIHDETLRLANHGYSAIEAAELIELPDSLAKFTPNSGTYGALNHNIKGVWQRYLGWFDGNPANLHSLPPSAMGLRYVKALGGAEVILKQAKTALEGEDLRWAAELLKQLLAAEPSHVEARALQASVFEQLAYRSESGVWRNFYLAGAAELTDASGGTSGRVSYSSDELLDAISTEMSLDYMAIRLNGPKAKDLEFTFALSIYDSEETYRVSVGRSVMSHRRVANALDCDLTVRVAKRDFARLASGATNLADLRASNSLDYQGDIEGFERLISVMDVFDGGYQLVTPRLKA